MRRSFKGNPSLMVALVILAIVILFGPATRAQERLLITINDVVEAPEEQGILEVSLANPVDEIGSIVLHLMLTRNDIANFEVVSESGHFWIEVDTVGTLLSGCQSVSAEAILTGEMGLDLRLIAHSNWPALAHGLMPQSGQVLFRVPVNIMPMPPIPLDDYTAEACVSTDYGQWFDFATPEGESIGWTTEQVTDTSYYMCTMWEPPPGEECLEWTKVFKWECPDGECDSVIIQTYDIPVIDETQVTIDNGSVTMDVWVCGDVNGDGNVTIGDISVMIDHLFINNPPIDPIEPGNVNCSTEQPVVLTIGDISTLIDHLFVTQGPLCCIYY